MSDDEYEGMSLRASLSRERTALLQKLLNSKDAETFSTASGSVSSAADGRGPRISSLKAQALLKSAKPLRSPTSDTPSNTGFFGSAPVSHPKPSVTTSTTSSVSKPPQNVTSPAVRAAAAAGIQRRASREMSSERPSSNGSNLESRKVQFRETSSSSPQMRPAGVPTGDVEAGRARKQSIVKAAQIFGDARLVENAPKSLKAGDPNEDLKAKVLADKEFVAEREQAKQQRLKEVLEAQPTKEQLGLPEVQRQRKASVKAMQVLGSQELEREMQQNVGQLPYDPSKPQNNKAARVLGSVGILAQPKVEKVLGPSTDAEDAQARNNARDAWDKEVDRRKSFGNVMANKVLRKFGSSAASSNTSLAPAIQTSASEKQPSMTSPLSSSFQKVSSFSKSSSSFVSSAGQRLSFRGTGSAEPKASKAPTAPAADLDQQIKQRQAADESRELASMLGRFSMKD